MFPSMHPRPCFIAILCSIYWWFFAKILSLVHLGVESQRSGSHFHSRAASSTLPCRWVKLSSCSGRYLWTYVVTCFVYQNMDSLPFVICLQVIAFGTLALLIGCWEEAAACKTAALAVCSVSLQEPLETRHNLVSVNFAWKIGCLSKGKAHACLCWWRSIVVRPLVLASELSLSCARLTAGRVTTISQPTWPTQPAIPPGSVK